MTPTKNLNHSSVNQSMSTSHSTSDNHNKYNCEKLSDLDNKWFHNHDQPIESTSKQFFHNRQEEAISLLKELHNKYIFTHSIIEKSVTLVDKFPLLTLQNLNEFKGIITDDNGCPLTLIDFPVKSIDSFADHDQNLFEDWIFYVYFINNKYHISQYTKEGAQLAHTITPPLDLKLRVNLDLGVSITFQDLQILESCFQYELTSKKMILQEVAGRLKKTLEYIKYNINSLHEYTNLVQNLIELKQPHTANKWHCKNCCNIF